MSKLPSHPADRSAEPSPVSDILTKHIDPLDSSAIPARASIHVSSVQICKDTTHADQLLGKQISGYAYQRDGHANETILAERCRLLHQAEFAAITPNGMSALALALLATVEPGQRVLVSNQLYGRTKTLFGKEAARFGISAEYFDVFDLNSLRPTMFSDIAEKPVRLIVVETISNPLMRVADLRRLSEIATEFGADLLVDNTFASPLVCRPLELGATWVMESLTKVLNGHSDVTLGVLCSRKYGADRVDQIQRTWGFVAAPFECWLADRGLGTARLRIVQSSRSAQYIANFLQAHSAVKQVNYPGLVETSDHALARQQFLCDGEQVTGEPSPLFGHMLSFELDSREHVDAFIHGSGLLFCPSLGDLGTTISHPATTSHRGLKLAERTAQGITDGLVRISIGIEPLDELFVRFRRGLESSAKI
ncbi:MAG TPA: aminotransferase class I/II-fold pyridoxal phosphate-dependent enzyme [Pirellulaceae bacterium]|nr:aminotransferase class I/II-fold pyridoxal phosphate-dependent enzyme [Pirellulaceae bacterium]HMO93793.1 aminotransferase class I/II-fold pyridoxal phosphate-dependent enzyme [Pirellulaceae bacterium]HMP70613.1 aminotransferase class I/II-fold pyridoxal phosphate-dependent enzyme [Pirellulaceae bacterium]